MKLGVFTVMLPDLTPEEAARALRETGYDGVEWRVKGTPEALRGDVPSFWGNNRCTLEPTPAEAERARRLAAEAGLAIPNLGTYLEVGDLEATEAAMRFARQAGSPQLRVGAGAPDGSYAESFARARAYLEGVETLAKRYGVRALIELHHRTICPSASLAHRLVSACDPAHIGVIYDPGNMVFEGFEDPRLGLELLGPYLAHVHLKNARYERPEGAACGGRRGRLWRTVWSIFRRSLPPCARSAMTAGWWSKTLAKRARAARR